MIVIPDRSQLSQQVANSYSVVNNTFAATQKNNPKDKIQVEIGDTKQPDFYPQLKIMRWDNEVNFSIRWQDNDVTPAIIQTQGKIIKYVKGSKEAHFYSLDPKEGMEDGGHELEIVFASKPITNIVTFSIQTKGLDFFYQPPLTEEEIAMGAQRPDNVVGSYAVYHKTKRNNCIEGKSYQTGKAFHIYRPKVTDSEGNEAWADLSIDEQVGVLTITIPQTFIDSAIYPIIVDPTMGYTTAGGSNVAVGTVPFFCNTTASSNGTIGTLTTYIGSSTSRAWVTTAINCSITSGTTYWLAGWQNGASVFGNAVYADSASKPNTKLAEDVGNTTALGSNVGYDTVSSYSFYYSTGWTFETWNSPATSLNLFASNNRISIYATYSTGTLDQHQDSIGTNFGFGEFAGARYRGQNFTPTISGNLISIGFDRAKGSTDIKVYIDTTTSNLPTHSVGSELYSFTISNANLFDGFGIYDLPTPLALTSGTEYCFYLAPFSSGSYTDDYHDCHGINSTPGGKEITNSNGSWSNETLTFHFTTYIDNSGGGGATAPNWPVMMMGHFSGPRFG